MKYTFLQTDSCSVGSSRTDGSWLEERPFTVSLCGAEHPLRMIKNGLTGFAEQRWE